jgi:hypothetical protein
MVAIALSGASSYSIGGVMRGRGRGNKGTLAIRKGVAPLAASENIFFLPPESSLLANKKLK